jgi:hypothetical protein
LVKQLDTENVLFERMAKSVKATKREGSTSDDAEFNRTLKSMSDTPPKPHVEMKKGAAPKRDARSSGEGSKS